MMDMWQMIILMIVALKFFDHLHKSIRVDTMIEDHWTNELFPLNFHSSPMLTWRTI